MSCLKQNIRHDINVIVDRLVLKDGIRTRLADTIETALDMSDGLLYIEDASTHKKKKFFSSKFACPESGFTIAEIEPRLFSFNSPLLVRVKCV